MSTAVVIPLYNHERYIVEALRSVLAQTRPVQRVVIIDDGSTDRSVDTVRREFGREPRIQLLTQSNAGAHHTINRGVREAARDCEFIAILNSDDVFAPARLERCVRFLEAKPELAVVCTRLRMIDSESRELAPGDPKARWIDSLWAARRERLVEWLGIANFAKTSSNFVARSPYLVAHPFGSYRYVHDYFFAVTAALEHKLGVIDEELLLYRTHPSNTIKSGPADNLTREVIRMNLDLLRHLAPTLETSAEVRADYTRYFRLLCLNHADFRAEVFFSFIAQLLRQQRPADVLENAIAALTGERFPELIASKSPALRESLATTQYETLLRTLATSRWMALGRVFGVTLDILREAPTAEKRLSHLRKRCEESRWFQLGRQLGFVYVPSVQAPPES